MLTSVSQVRGLGGKLGDLITEKLGVVTMAELAQVAVLLRIGSFFRNLGSYMDVFAKLAPFWVFSFFIKLFLDALASLGLMIVTDSLIEN